MKLGIVGGSFNPIHYGHLGMGSSVLDRLDLDEVWMMPCYKHAFEKDMSEFDHRYNMTKLAVESVGEKKVKVSNYENLRKGASYTYDTISGFLEKDRDLDIHWIVGSDIMDSFERWKRPHDLLKMSKLVVIKRGKEPSYMPENSIYIDDPNIPNISSTEIRNLLGENKSIEGLTPVPVIEYIKENKLYARNHGTVESIK